MAWPGHDADRYPSPGWPPTPTGFGSDIQRSCFCSKPPGLSAQLEVHCKTPLRTRAETRSHLRLYHGGPHRP